MDRDAGKSDREEEALQGDTGMIGSESEEPGPGRDTSLTEPDPVAAGADRPQGTVAMSEGDPMRTRLGSHVEGAGVIGYDVAASEEGPTQQTPAEDRPGYEPERSVGDAAATATAPTSYERDPGLAAEPVVDRRSYERDPGLAAEPVVHPVEDVGSPGTSAVADDPARFGAGDAMADPGRAGAAGYGGEAGAAGVAEAPERLDRPGPQEPGVQEGVYDQEADQAREQRPSEGR